MSRTIERAVEISTKLLEAKQAASQICGDKYEEIISPYKSFINEAIKKMGKPPAEVVLALLKRTSDDGSDMDLLLMTAASYEVMRQRQ